MCRRKKRTQAATFTVHTNTDIIGAVHGQQTFAQTDAIARSLKVFEKQSPTPAIVAACQAVNIVRQL